MAIHPSRGERLSLSISLGRQTVADPDSTQAVALVREVPRPTDRRAHELDALGGAVRPISLRFLDSALEQGYQRVAGAESLTGFRITTAAAAAMWSLAAVVIPTGTPIPFERAVIASFGIALLNWAAFVLSERFETLDQQHAILSFLTSVNGLVILWLASTGGVLPGYGISAIMLLFAFGFVSRTGFVFAAWRTAVISVGYVVAAALYPGRGSLLVDDLIFGAAVAGTLIALRLLEQSRRRVFYQDIVITRQADAVQAAMDRADQLLHNMLPTPISSRLLEGERTIADEYPSVTVLFADIVGFTPLTRRLPPREVVALLDRLFARFDELVADRGLEKIKTIGDAYMVAGGLPEPLEDHAARVVDLGLAMLDAAAEDIDAGAEVRLRVGVHTGPVIGGVIGQEKLAFDIWGETVNIASRLESQGVPGRVHVSSTTARSVGADFEMRTSGQVHLRGHGPMDTYTVVGRTSPDADASLRTPFADRP